jgi:hypothetical protein
LTFFTSDNADTFAVQYISFVCTCKEKPKGGKLNATLVANQSQKCFLDELIKKNAHAAKHEKDTYM